MSHHALAPMAHNKREECIEMCSVDDPLEYPFFEQHDMEAYLVQIRLGESSTVTESVAPLVVLDAAVFCRDNWEEEACWQTMPGFSEGSIPGFTMCGRAVMLIKSVQLGVDSVEDLHRLGISAFKLPDSDSRALLPDVNVQHPFEVPES